VYGCLIRVLGRIDAQLERGSANGRRMRFAMLPLPSRAVMAKAKARALAEAEVNDGDEPDELSTTRRSPRQQQGGSLPLTPSSQLKDRPATTAAVARTSAITRDHCAIAIQKTVRAKIIAPRQLEEMKRLRLYRRFHEDELANAMEKQWVSVCTLEDDETALRAEVEESLLRASRDFRSKPFSAKSAAIGSRWLRRTRCPDAFTKRCSRRSKPHRSVRPLTPSRSARWTSATASRCACFATS
jgi:hypothetical protein